MPTPSQSKFMRELGFHIRASYPFILTVTDEHDRFHEEVEALCSSYLNKETKLDHKFTVMRWTCTDHWTTKGGKSVPNTSGSDDPPNPATDFQMIKGFEPFTICIMENFHFYMTREHPDLIQMVRDLSRHCQQRNKTVIFANCVMDFPRELEAYITVLNHDLPMADDIDKTVDAMVDSVKEKNLDVKMNDERRYVVRESLKGMRLSDIENALAYSIVTTKGFDPQVLLAEKCKAIKKSGLLEYIQSGETFNLIGGLENLKKWLSIWQVTFTDKAKKFNLPPPRGVLLLGVPGCGKTLVAQATANFFNLPLIRFDLANVFSKYVGESEQNMRSALKIVDAVAPCVLHIDEIEKGMAGASSANSTDGGTSPRTFGEFLKWQNDHKTPVFVVATSNNLESIPVEYLRKGRFDEIFFVDIPNVVERGDIVKKQLERQKLEGPKYDVPKLVDASSQFTGAEIASAISIAKIVAANRNEHPSTEDILRSMKDIIPEAKKNADRINSIRQRASQLAVPATLDEKPAPSEVQTKDGKWRNVVT